MRKNILPAALSSMIFMNVESKIQIINPEWLYESVADEDHLIDNGMANFGHIDYGSSIVSGFCKHLMTLLSIARASLCTTVESKWL